MIQRPLVLLNGIAFACVAAVAFALVSQHVFDMPPCAWCVFQRLIFLVIAAVCWAGVIAARYYAPLMRISAALAALLGVGGVLAAWYQYSVASAMFSCDLTFADRFMTTSGLDAGLPWLFGIFATCMDARADILGVEYALWSMALFVAITLIAATASRDAGR